MEIVECMVMIAVITALFVWYGIAFGRRENRDAKLSRDVDVSKRPNLGAAPQGFKTFTT